MGPRGCDSRLGHRRLGFFHAKVGCAFVWRFMYRRRWCSVERWVTSSLNIRREHESQGRCLDLSDSPHLSMDIGAYSLATSFNPQLYTKMLRSSLMVITGMTSLVVSRMVWMRALDGVEHEHLEAVNGGPTR